MSYIVRSGRLSSAGPLSDAPGEEYVYAEIEVLDRFWNESDPEMDAETIYTVMVTGQAAINLSAIALSGLTPNIVFSGRYIVRQDVDPNGARRIVHEVTGDHVGVHLSDPMLARTPPKAGTLS